MVSVIVATSAASSMTKVSGPKVVLMSGPHSVVGGSIAGGAVELVEDRRRSGWLRGARSGAVDEQPVQQLDGEDRDQAHVVRVADASAARASALVDQPVDDDRSEHA